MKKRIIAILLCGTLTLSTAAAVSAAETDPAPTAAHIEAGIVAADYAPVGSELEPESPLPAYYSSLELGYTTSVRSQKYSACWAYSSTAVMEVLLNKQDRGIGQLSPMDMNFRSVKSADGTGWQRSYFDAGYPYIALGCLTSFGVVPEGDVPENITQDEYTAIRDMIEPYAFADSIIYLEGSDTETVKTAVYNYGAAVGNFHYDTAKLNESTSAYYCDTDYIATSNLYGHAVAIIGWDDSYSAENFVEGHRPSGDGAWLCKNSWGEWWSSSYGYFWISYEDKHLFDYRFGPSYSISGVTYTSDSLRLKQNEVYGATYEFDYPDNLGTPHEVMTYANVFDFSDGYNIIDKVTFESTSVGSEYDVFYIPTDENGIPLADETAWVPLYTGTIAYEGYICADFDDYRAAKGTGAVGVRIRSTAPSGSVAIGAGEWLAAGSKQIFYPESRRGMSYLLGYNEEPYDVMDFYHDALEDDIGGTFVIKAQTLYGRQLGDVDGDGEVTILDATWIQRYLASLIEFDDAQTADADYDRDGSVSILDATAIQRMLAGIID